jgi:hypothetical protein
MVGRIHPEAERLHFDENPDHRDVVRSFLTAFDVTRAFWKKRGNDRLACFFMKPEPFIAELVGFEREILLSYAPFQELQARAVALHDEVLNVDRARLDPMGSVLVSDDQETKRRLADIVSTEPERPPIIGISRTELAAIRSADDLRGLLFANLYQRDLFAFESALRTDTTFFGREDIVAVLVDRFRSGQNSGLFGLRRIGKTSVLYAVRRRLSSGELAGSAYLDVSSPAVYQSRWWELLQILVRAFADPLDLQRADRSRLRALSVQYSEHDAAAHFKADIFRLAEQYPGSRLLLQLDEVEHITFDISPAAHWANDYLPFWQTLRSVHQDSQGRFGFLTVGVNPHILETDRVGRFDNPLFSTTKPFYLGPFDQPALREMVRNIGKYMGLRVEEGVYTRLLEEYGGHPFLVRQACSHLARRVPVRPGQITAALYEKERSHIAVALEKNVKQILNVLAIWYPDEFEMIRLLARGDRSTFLTYAIESAAFTEHVEGYGLVRDARGEPKIRVGLVREYLSRIEAPRAMPEADSADRDAVLAEISRRRNAIEGAFRRVLRDGMLFAHGKKAADAAYSALNADRRAVLSQVSYEAMWEELYFDELIAILKKQFDHFSKYFAIDQPKMMSWLDQINRCRADAHARTLGNDDLAFLRVCLKRMEEALSL